MRNKVNALPITLDREVKFYVVEECNPLSYLHYNAMRHNTQLSQGMNAFYGSLDLSINSSKISFPDLEQNVILTTDGSNVEFWDGFIFDERRPPLDALRIDLHITFDELFKMALTTEMFVDLIMVSGNKVRVTITTKHDTIYNQVLQVD